MKRFLCIVLAVAMTLGCCSFAFAASKSEKQAADALNNLDLFQGVSTTKLDYALDKSLTRGEGYILLIRLLGKDADAKACNYTCPFTDAKGTFYERYAAYAYATGLTKGIGNNKFGATMAMNEQMFATVCLRSLGYSEDSGDFSYSKAIATAKAKGLPVTGAGSFDRGNAVGLMWQTLNTSMKSGASTLAGQLISQGVFSANALEVSKKVEAGTLTYVKGGEGFGPGVSNGVVAKPSTSGKSASQAKADYEAARKAAEAAKAEEEAKKKAAEEAARLRREAEEAARKAEEAAKKAKEAAEKKAAEEAARKAQEEADRLKKEQEEAAEAARKAEEERIAAEEAAKKAQEEADRIAAEEAARKAKEEADRLAKEEAERIKREQEEAAKKAAEEAAKKGTDQKSEFETPLMPL